MMILYLDGNLPAVFDLILASKEAELD